MFGPTAHFLLSLPLTGPSTKPVSATRRFSFPPTETATMGNNASSTRKSAALRHAAAYRKSSQSQAAANNLEEEFSTLILHEVKRQSDAGIHPDTNASNSRISQMEDEFNELNDDLLESEVYAVERNILPDEESSDPMQVDPAPALDLREPPVAVKTHDDPSSELFGDLDRVDFTRIADPARARHPIARSSSALSTTPQNSGAIAAGGLGAVLDASAALVPVEIKWVNLTKQAITKVAIIGTFSQWRDVIKLKRLLNLPMEYSTVVKLPLGVHKLLYIVNNEYRVLDQLPTATDQEGIFFNWFEVLDPLHLFNQPQHPPHRSSSGYDANIIQVAGELDASLIQKKSNSFLFKVSVDEKNSLQHVESVNQGLATSIAHPQDHPQYADYHNTSMLSLLVPDAPPEVFSSEIPEMFVDYNYFKSMSPNYELPEPPQLPAHLNNVLLNKISTIQQQNHAQIFPQVGSDPNFSHRPSLRRADSSYYASNKQAYHQSIPNHVILNHLMTTSIRNDVLTVACITRYSGKFVTQIMHSPATIGDGGA